LLLTQMQQHAVGSRRLPPFVSFLPGNWTNLAVRRGF
jgi:hypothetical protein